MQSAHDPVTDACGSSGLPVYADRTPYDDARLFPRGLRALAPDEIDELERAGCRADDWSLVRVAPGFHAADVRSVRFRGRVAIGSTGHDVERAAGLVVRSGLDDATVSDCALSDGVLVDRVGLMHRVALAAGAVVTTTDELTHEPGGSFANGRVLRLVCNPGGRPVAIHALMTFEDACVQASDPAPREAEGARAAAAWRSDWAWIGDSARVGGCGRLESAWIGPGAVVRGAAAIERSTVFSTGHRPTEVRDGAIVRDAVLQWGVRVADGAFVAESMIFEGSVVERHGIVQGSVIGPDCVVAEGEVSKSLVGPLVGFHHQALLVSAYWPEGRGNVGYGANVGSNHTGKAPDQEIRPGEGAFFGLGVNVKYPSDWSRAPYLLLASGTDTLPQRITLPFSLVAAPARAYADCPPALNDIFPGWVLSENPYALLRNELKFAERHRAERSRVDVRVFRPVVVDSVVGALGALEALGGKSHYTERDLAGIGKNVLTEAARLDGIAAYRSTLRRLALAEAAESILGSVPRTGDSGSLSGFLGPDVGSDPVAVLRLHAAETRRWADAVEACKARDDRRGPRVIEDYASVHPPASEDPVVLRAHDESRRTGERVRTALASMGVR